MKKLIVLALLAISFMNCEKEELTENQQDLTIETEAVIGTWELYRDETLESVIDEWTGSEWTYVDKWFQNTRENSRIIFEFKDDGTFVDRYANVEVASGVWVKTGDNSYYFDYVQDGNSSNEQLTQRRYITFYCNNTFSIEIEGNDRAIYYYKTIGTIECSDLITYNVE